MPLKRLPNIPRPPGPPPGLPGLPGLPGVLGCGCLGKGERGARPNNLPTVLAAAADALLIAFINATNGFLINPV